MSCYFVTVAINLKLHTFINEQISQFQVGDQLLDVCGLNLRGCGKEQASLVLQQVGNSISMKVQFNPMEYHSLHTMGGSGNGSGARSRVGPDLRRRNEVEEEEVDEESSDASNSGEKLGPLKPS